MSKYFSEWFGTFVLVFAGTGAIIVNDELGGQITHLGIAAVFGLVVMAMIYAVGDVSGAHLNPAVTFGFVLAGRFPMKEALPYVCCQSMGALMASLIWRILFDMHVNLGATQPKTGAMDAFILEVVLAFILMFVILSVSTGAKEKGIMAGAAIGAVVGFEALFAGPISGASMNPARSLGPALVSGQLNSLWIYLLAPTIGAGLAVLGCKIMRTPDCCGGAC